MGTRRVAATVLVGAPLWMLYGPLTMLNPWGLDVVYRDSLGYSEVVDVSSFLLYSLPGALALVLSAVGLLGVVSRLQRGTGGVEKFARGSTCVALGLGLISLVGVVTLFDPVFTAGRIFGTLLLGGAALLTSLGARRGGAASAWVWALFLVGALGVFLMPLWPLVFALGWLAEETGAMVIVSFGVGWMWIGWRLWNESDALALGASER